MSCFARGQVRECYGREQGHHVVPQQRIRDRHRTLLAAYRRGMGLRPWSLRRALEDRRLQVRVCWGHHQLVEQRRVYVRELPDGFWEAVREFGLEPLVEQRFIDARGEA